MSKVGVKHYSDRPCRNCQKIFSPVRSWMVFCSDDCHDNFWKGKNLPAKIVKIEKNLTSLESRVEKLEAK